MLFNSLLLLSLVKLPLVVSPSVSCACGWQLRDNRTLFTHRLHNDFSQFSYREDLDRDWLINGYYRGSDNARIRKPQQFDVKNVELGSGFLALKQSGYSDDDWVTNKPVRVAGIQTKNVNILYGSFRTVLKIEGDNGGSVGSFFWYHNDSSEIDIEIITRGTSILNNTINYTSHPSTYFNGTPIFNATRSVSLDQDNVLATYRQHRFDCHPLFGAQYFLDDSLVHWDGHSIPQSAGNVQLNLWADGDQLWSGIPSKTDATMFIKMIEMYYNTTDSNDLDGKWYEGCRLAGGPGPGTVCREGMTLDEDDPRTWAMYPGDFRGRTSYPGNRTYAPFRNVDQQSRAAHQGSNFWAFGVFLGWRIVLELFFWAQRDYIACDQKAAGFDV